MQPHIQPCPYCHAYLKFSRPVYSLVDDPLNDIYLCECGLVYKPAFNINANRSTGNIYSVNSWMPALDQHRQRLAGLVDDLLKDRPELASGMKFLDVGAGIGLLYEQLRRHIKSDAVYVALEPVANIAHFLKKQFPGVLVLNGDINEAGLPDGVFDAVFVCGVDYLFVDIDAAFRKIARCVKKDGVIVIQRNVFLDQTGYAAKPIRNMTEMFSDNAIIRNWFHSGQYESYLDGIFQIEQRRRAEVSVPFQGTSFRTFTDTYVCTPRPAAPQMYSERPSFLEKSEQLLAELAKGEAALPVAQDPSGQKPLNALSINLGALPGGAKFY